MNKKELTIVGVSGFSSNVGKTELVCDLLRLLPEWEAIKITRGHFRSCGRDPEACCVSDQIRDEPVILSGRAANYQSGKDTGRFWDAGASNVHWVIVQDGQVEKGITEALARVEAPGVIVEGNSFLNYVVPDIAVMCARSEGGIVKPSARQVLGKTSLLYLSSLEDDGVRARKQFDEWRSNLSIDLPFAGLSLITREDIPELAVRVLTLVSKSVSSGS